MYINHLPRRVELFTVGVFVFAMANIVCVYRIYINNIYKNGSKKEIEEREKR